MPCACGAPLSLLPGQHRPNLHTQHQLPLDVSLALLFARLASQGPWRPGPRLTACSGAALKGKVCKRCRSLLVPGASCSFRVRGKVLPSRLVVAKLTPSVVQLDARRI